MFEGQKIIKVEPYGEPLLFKVTLENGLTLIVAICDTITQTEGV